MDEDVGVRPRPDGTGLLPKAACANRSGRPTTFFDLPAEIRQPICDEIVSSVIPSSDRLAAAAGLSNVMNVALEHTSHRHRTLQQHLKGSLEKTQLRLKELVKTFADINDMINVHLSNDTRRRVVLDYESACDAAEIGIMSEAQPFVGRLSQQKPLHKRPFDVYSFKMLVAAPRDKVEVWTSDVKNKDNPWKEQVYEFWRQTFNLESGLVFIEKEDEYPARLGTLPYIGVWKIDGKIKSVVYNVPFYEIMCAPLPRLQLLLDSFQGYLDRLQAPLK